MDSENKQIASDVRIAERNLRYKMVPLDLVSRRRVEVEAVDDSTRHQPIGISQQVVFIAMR
jgi:alkylhydroperoxidase family enzyme